MELSAGAIRSFGGHAVYGWELDLVGGVSLSLICGFELCRVSLLENKVSGVRHFVPSDLWTAAGGQL